MKLEFARTLDAENERLYVEILGRADAMTSDDVRNLADALTGAGR